MRINHNIAALRANNQLARTNNLLDKSLEKLSSGYRINSAADDSAGLAISEKMRTQIAGLDQASRNASDGISVIQTAEGALSEVESMLQRMRELGVESANGTYTSDDRDAIQSEIDQLNQEITRISNTTEFNKMTLLNGNIDRKSYSSDNSLSIVSMSDTVAVGSYSIKVTQDARQAVIVGNATDFDGLSASKRKITKDEAGSISINGESVTVNEGDTVDEVFEKIRNACDNVDLNVFAAAKGSTPSTTNNLDTAGYTSKSLSDNDQLVFVSKEYGSDQKIDIYCDNSDLCNILGLTIKGASSKGYDAKAELVLNADNKDSNFQNTATISTDGNKITVSDNNDFELVFQVNPGTVGSKFTDALIKNASDPISTSYPPNTIMIGNDAVTITQDARQAVLVGNTTSATTATENSVLTINGTTINVTAGESIDNILSAINANVTGVNAYAIAPNSAPSTTTNPDKAGYTTKTFASGDQLLFVTDDYGDDATLNISCDKQSLCDLLGLTSAGASVKGYDAKAEFASDASTSTMSIDGNEITVTDKAGVISTKTISTMVGTKFTDSTVTGATAAISKASSTEPETEITVSILDAGPMDLQIGANEGQTMSVRIPKVTPQTLGIDNINVGTADGAQQAISLLDKAVDEVSAIRSKLGAYQNRLEHSISNLDVSSENMTESLSRIQDVDMASEMAEYTQKNVLAQAGTSMLAQANQRPQQILSLLQQ